MKRYFILTMLSALTCTSLFAEQVEQTAIEYEYVDELPIACNEDALLRARGKEKPIVVVIPSYNNKRWCLQNIRSVLSQNYNNFRIVYIDDCSPDSTYNIVKQEIGRQDAWDVVTLVRNTSNRGSLANFYQAVHACPDDAIIVCLDGDDWLEPGTLAYLNEVYRNADVWLTYGQFKFWPSGKRGYCAPITDIHKIRRLCGNATHLKTFYAWLFKRIKAEDLMLNGDFFRVTGDKAMMAPMLEMAADGHFVFIDKVLYVYNQSNPLSDARVRGRVQNEVARVIFAKVPYKPIKLKKKHKLKKR